MGKIRSECMMNTKEFQFTVVLAAIALVVFRLYPQVNFWRLTKPSAIRPFYLTLEPGSTLGILGATIAGPIAGMILGLVSWNPIFQPEVLIIVKATQFFMIGYLHKKIQPPYDILAIPLGVLISAIVHPTLIHYIFYKQVIVHLYWGTNIVFQATANLIFYILIRLIIPQVYRWVNPDVDRSLKLPFLRNNSK
jgi:hypothetical protein